MEADGRLALAEEFADLSTVSAVFMICATSAESWLRALALMDSFVMVEAAAARIPALGACSSVVRVPLDTTAARRSAAVSSAEARQITSAATSWQRRSPVREIHKKPNKKKLL